MIRTRTRHLLGPISKEKLLELVENGSIHEDDEICSGNGYWFNLRETDLVNSYIYSDVEQSFNPVSEALNEVRLREQQREMNERITEVSGEAELNTPLDNEKEITRSISMDEIQAEVEKKDKKATSPFPEKQTDNTDTDLGLLGDLESPDILNNRNRLIIRYEKTLVANNSSYNPPY